MYTPAEWTKRETEYRAREERQKKLEAVTVAMAQPGQMQAERDTNQQGEESLAGPCGRSFRQNRHQVVFVRPARRSRAPYDLDRNFQQ